jgi:hypothetical protein
MPRAAYSPQPAAGGISYDFTTAVVPTANSFAFTRASSGSRFNSSGTLVLETTNVLRFDYNPATLAIKGMLYEPAATNLRIRSAEIDNASWSKDNVTITANSVAAPDGNTVAETVTDTTTNNVHGGHTGTIATTAATDYTTSHHFKYNSLVFSTLSICEAGSQNGGYAAFNIQTGAVTQSAALTAGTLTGATITDIGGGWYRATVTARIASGSTAYYTVGTANAGTFVTEAYGREIHGGTTNAQYWWGSQAEIGARATSYIPTTTAAVTRAADNASFTIPAGVATLRYTFDDSSTQDVSVSPGSYTIPTNLNRPWIKTIVSL